MKIEEKEHIETEKKEEDTVNYTDVGMGVLNIIGSTISALAMSFFAYACFDSIKAAFISGVMGFLLIAHLNKLLNEGDTHWSKLLGKFLLTVALAIMTAIPFKMEMMELTLITHIDTKYNVQKAEHLEALSKIDAEYKIDKATLENKIWDLREQLTEEENKLMEEEESGKGWRFYRTANNIKNLRKITNEEKTKLKQMTNNYIVEREVAQKRIEHLTNNNQADYSFLNQLSVFLELASEHNENVFQKKAINLFTISLICLFVLIEILPVLVRYLITKRSAEATQTTAL